MYFKIEGIINQKTYNKLKYLYEKNDSLDYLIINSQGGDLEIADNLVNLILHHQPLIPTIIEEKAFSAAAYIFLNLKNRYILKNSTLFIHKITINIYSPDYDSLILKSKKYSKLLRNIISSEFKVSLHEANKWLQESKAFSDFEIAKSLNCILLHQPINKHYEQFGSLSERFI